MRKILLVLALLLAACKGPEPVTVRFAIDCSGSAYSDPLFIASARSNLVLLADGLLPSGIDHLNVMRFGARLETIWDAARPEPLTALTDVLIKYLNGACEGRGSRITEVLERAADAANAGTTQVGVVLYSDGVLADDPEAARFGDAVAELVAAQQVKAVWIAGLRSEGEWRDSVIRDLEPLAQSGKLVLSGLEDAPAAMQAFRKLLGR